MVAASLVGRRLADSPVTDGGGLRPTRRAAYPLFAGGRLWQQYCGGDGGGFTGGTVAGGLACYGWWETKPFTMGRLPAILRGGGFGNKAVGDGGGFIGGTAAGGFACYGWWGTTPYTVGRLPAILRGGGFGNNGVG
jgi:hypothetical protein